MVVVEFVVVKEAVILMPLSLERLPTELCVTSSRMYSDELSKIARGGILDIK